MNKLPIFLNAIPQTFDESISYYEQLSTMLTYINSLQEQINELQNEDTKYIDEQIALLRQEINVLLLTLETNLVDKINTDIQALTIRVDSLNNLIQQINNNLLLELNKTNAKVAQVETDLSTDIKNVNLATDAKIDLAIKENNIIILDEVSKEFSNLKILNPNTGESITIQEMFDYLLAFHTTDTLSYGYLVAMNLTYDELVAKNLTYYQLTNYAKELLGENVQTNNIIFNYPVYSYEDLNADNDGNVIFDVDNKLLRFRNQQGKSFDLKIYSNDFTKFNLQGEIITSTLANVEIAYSFNDTGFTWIVQGDKTSNFSFNETISIPNDTNYITLRFNLTIDENSYLNISNYSLTKE